MDITAISAMMALIAAVIIYGGSLLLLLAILWGILWAFSKIGSAVLFRLWTAELTLRVSVQLWHLTKVKAPKGYRVNHEYLRRRRPKPRPTQDEDIDHSSSV